MTRDEILNMPAGREMDALVAEKIFRYEWQEFDGDIALCEPEEICRDSNYFRTYWPNRNHEFHDRRLDVSPYSTDISAAWEVVEKLRVKGRIILIVMDNNLCRVEFLSDEPLPLIVTNDNSVPLAICRAALIAKEEETK